MILDARKGDRARCYDAKRGRMVERVIWVNDETAQWGRSMKMVINGELALDVMQEDRITICPARGLVIFNEVDDSEPAACDATASIYI